MKKIVLFTIGLILLATFSFAGSVENIKVVRDLSTNTPVFGINQTGYVENLVLGAGVAGSSAVPSGATKVQFSCNQDFYVNYSTTAVVPTVTTTTGAGLVLNPVAIRNIPSGTTTISVISASAMICSLEYFK
jgi:hypothetical protein